MWKAHCSDGGAHWLLDQSAMGAFLAQSGAAGYNIRVIRAMLQRRGPRNTSNVGEASQGSPLEASLGELDTRTVN
jgi:hypothetical protein